MNLYQVQAILGKRYNKRFRRQEYKVKWVGYPDQEATWQPINNLYNVHDMLQEFIKTQNYTNGNKSESQKQKQAPLQAVEQQSNIKISVNDNSSINKQSQFVASSSSIEYKRKGIKKDRITKQKNQSKRQKSQSVYNKQEHILHLSLQSHNKVLPSKEQQVRYSHVQNRSMSKMNKQVENEQSLQQVLQLQVQSEKQDLSKFIIKGIFKRNQEFFYSVQDNGQNRWIAKNDILRQHPLALIEFYQSKIKYFPINKPSKIKTPSKTDYFKYSMVR